MNDLHEAYLNLGSNIDPENNLVRTIQLLFDYGEIKKISNAWESKAVGAEGPNFLNACLLFVSPRLHDELKEEVIHPIERKLGRKRDENNKYAPRTIDIDIILFDEELTDPKYWNFAYVVVPLAEIFPEYQNSTTQEKVTETATRLRRKVWEKARPEVLSRLRGSKLKSRE